MIVRTVQNPRLQNQTRTAIPESNRGFSVGTGNVAPITRTAMPMTQRTYRPPVENKQESTIVDLEFKAIEVKWSVDYDILGLNSQIIQYIKNKKERRKAIEGAIELCRQHKAKISNIDEIAALRLKIESLDRQLKEINAGSLLDYSAATAQIIDRYRKVSNNGPKIFGKKEIVDVSQLAQRTELVKQFLEVAVNYCPIKAIHIQEVSSSCQFCAGEIIDTGEQYVCLECQTVHHKIESQSESCNESGDMPNAKKASHDSNNNYSDIVKQFCGTYPVIISESVLGTIKSHLEKYIGFDMNKVTSYDILGAMKAMNMTSWYKHINKIRYLLTKKQPRDISQFVPAILKRGELLNEIWAEVKPDDRTNFIHGVYYLWISLMNEGAELDMEDFSLLKSRDCEIDNLKILQVAFPRLKRSHPELRWEIYQLP